jgi:hypothetical protein
MSAVALAVVVVMALTNGCARVHVRRAALEELAATIAAITAHAGNGRSTAPCVARSSSRR